MSRGAPSRPFLGALLLATALAPISLQMFLPALPAIQQAFAVSTGVAQLSLTASMVSIAFATLGYGPLSDRFGRRPVLIVGQLVFIAGSAACIVAPGMASLVAGRVLQAAGACAGMVLSRAVVRDAYPIEGLTRVLAYFTLAMAVFPMFTPTIGGLLIDWVHWRAVFVFSTAVGAVSMLAAVAFTWETRPALETRPTSTLHGMGRTLRTPVFWGYTLAGGFGSACFFGFISGVPYLVIQVMERPAREYGLYFVGLAGAFMVGSLLAARVSERVGRDRMIVLGGLGMLAAGLLLLLLQQAGFWHPLALFLPGMLLTFAQGLAGPNAQAGAVSGDAALVGTASGLFGFFQTLLAAAFAQAVGLLQDGTAQPLIVSVFVAATGSLVAIAAVRSRER